MTLAELRRKAHDLPKTPGVYLMKRQNGDIIYVGKAKALRNRVSQYFQENADHGTKTRAMVAQVFDFDVILVQSEFDALVLECNLIKQHMPKYNVLLKDDKGFPYIRLTEKAQYPRFSVVATRQKDGASYFGPYGGRNEAKSIIDTLCKTLKLPTCSRVFPIDIGKA
ncbi:MAG: GIY-YIG nuclease family protein, partial [Oscillospiraceae bacterium]|nr:GIY-YIG nuclease family protein [Oscillospiraceae bacterium]